MRIDYLPAAGYRRVRWRNGHGWTQEIARHPEFVTDSASPSFDWRVSVAELEADGPFSEFPGCERILVLLSGEGLTLQFGDGTEQPVPPPHGCAAFAGEKTPYARIAVPARVFNVMACRSVVDAQVFHRPVAGSMRFFAEANVQRLIFSLQGKISLIGASSSLSLAAGDSALLHGNSGKVSDRVILSGSGAVLLVRLFRFAKT